MKGKALTFLACLAMGTILAACGLTPGPLPGSTPTTRKEVIKVIAHCITDVGAYVWVDQNGNGKREQGEEPLREVQVTVYYSVSGRAVRSGVTDIWGNLSFGSWKYDPDGDGTCELEIEAATPPGYRPTMPTRIVINDGIAYFGFAPDDSAATPAP